MVYARYIKRDGKKLGPYYYKSVKGEDGKIRSVYLGSKPPIAKQEFISCEESSSVKSFSEEEPKTSPVICEKISQLKKNIQICEVRKTQIRATLGELAEKQEKGIISYVKHELLLNSYLNGKTVEYWDRYYDELKLRLAAQVKKYESLPREQVPGQKPVPEEVKVDLYSKVDVLSEKVEKLESLLAREPVKPKKQSFFELYELTPAGRLVAFMLIILLITAPGLLLFKDYAGRIGQTGMIQEKKEIEAISGEQTLDKRVLSKSDVKQEYVQETSLVSKLIERISQFFTTSSPTGLAVTEESNPVLPEEDLTIAGEKKTKDCSEFKKTDDGMFYCVDDKKLYDCSEFDLTSEEETIKCIGVKFLSDTVSKANCPFDHEDCNVTVDMNHGWGGKQTVEDEKYKLAVFNEVHHCDNGHCVVPFYFKSKTSFVGDLLFNISTVDTLIENISIVDKDGNNVNERESISMEQYDSGYYNAIFDYVPVWSSPTGIRYILPMKFNITAFLDDKKILELDPIAEGSSNVAIDADCQPEGVLDLATMSCNAGDIIIIGVSAELSAVQPTIVWGDEVFGVLGAIDAGGVQTWILNATCSNGESATIQVDSVYTEANNDDCSAVGMVFSGASYLELQNTVTPFVDSTSGALVSLTETTVSGEWAVDVYGSDGSGAADGENSVHDLVADAGLAVAGISYCNYNVDGSGDGNCLMSWTGATSEVLFASVLVPTLNTAPSLSNPKLSSVGASAETDPSYHNETLNMSVVVTETDADSLKVWFTAWGGNESETTPAVNVTFGNNGGITCTNSSATSWNGVTCEITSPGIDIYSIATGNFTGKWYAFDGTTAMVDITEDTIMTDAAPYWASGIADDNTVQEDVGKDIDASMTSGTGNCTDIDSNETGSLVFAVQAESGSGDFTVVNSNLSFISNANATGVADVTVRCSITGGLFADDSAQVTVNAVDDTPWWDYIVNNSISITEEGGSQLITNVSTYFRDVEDDQSPQNLMTPITNTTAVTCSYTNDQLYCNPTTNYTGPFIVNITMQDSGGITNAIQQDFEITVNNVNDAPWWDNIANGTVSITEDTANQNVTIGWRDYWWDVEENHAPTQWDVFSNSSDSPCARNAGGDILCSTTNNLTGNIILILSAEDSSGSNITASFEVTINAVNDNPWMDLIGNTTTITEDNGAQQIVANFNTYFRDVENDQSTTQATFVTNASDVTCAANGNALECTPVNNFTGAVDINYTGWDSGMLAAQQDFIVVINDYNDIPWWDAISNNSEDSNGPANIVQNSGLQPLGKSGNDFNASYYWWDVEDGQALGMGDGNLTIETNDTTKVVCALGDNLGSANNWSIFCSPATGFVGDFIVTLNGSDSNNPPGWGMYSFEGYVTTANTAPNAPALILNFTEDNVNFTNATMWCEVSVTDPESNPMSIDIIVANNTVDNNYVQQWRLDNAFTSVASGSKVQFQIHPDNYTFGDYAICQAVANDGSLDGPYTNSSSLLVQNSLPWWDSVINQTCTEDDSCSNLINLDFFSHDVDDDLAGVNMTYSIASESDNTIIDCSITAAEMTCVNQNINKTGDNIVNVSALDGQGASESIWYNISVMPVNDMPWWNETDNSTYSFNEDFGLSYTIWDEAGLNNTFWDVEENHLPFNCTADTNDTSIVKNVTYSDGAILADSVENAFGNVIITVNCSDIGWESALTSFEITVNAVNDAPEVENIFYQSGLGANGALTEGIPTQVIASFLVMDFDGINNIDNGSAMLNVSLDGADTRENASALDYGCYPETIGSNATAQNYTCTMMMQHWDLGGDWKCTAQTGDKIVNTTKDVPNCFTVGTTLSLNMTSTNITWSNLYVGYTNTLMDTAELNITNIGNANISNVTLRAYDLIGLTTPTDFIEANNFTATWGERLCDYGQYLINGTNLQILANGTANNPLNFAEPTNAITNNATHICLEHVGDGLSQQSYSATGNTLASEKYWQITGGTGTI